MTVPTVTVWFLWLWSQSHEPFEGGQYLDRARCERAGPRMAIGLEPYYGRGLKWRCELRSL